MSAQVIGWSASLLLFVTLVQQMWRQWHATDTEGVSGGLFVGQFLASVGFLIYSALTGDVVFIVTNGALALTAAAGYVVLQQQRRREEAAPPPPTPASPPSEDQIERERERALYLAVLDGMSDAVLAVDRHRRVLLMNPAARELLGFSGDPIGRSLLELIRAPALQELLGPIGDAAERGSIELDLPGGQRRLQVTLGRPRAGGASVLVLQDVTTLRRLETIRRDFVANVSHELRTPISVITANVETLLAGAIGEVGTATALVEAIDRNAGRLRLLIEDLLDLSRLEAGKYELAASPVELAGAARRAAEAMGGKAAQRTIELSLDVADGVSAMANAEALHQVLVNLLENAVKYTQAGGHVAIRAGRVGAQVHVSVIDDGPGIEMRHRERIFERFYRIDPGRSRDMGGTGLGLSIVKHLVEAMGGQISVDGNVPRGSVFRVALPAADPSPG